MQILDARLGAPVVRVVAPGFRTRSFAAVRPPQESLQPRRRLRPVRLLWAISSLRAAPLCRLFAQRIEK